MEVARFQREVIIVGNLHAARWPLQLLTALRGIGCRVLTFVPRRYLFTGRCAYPGSCSLYLTGCNRNLPHGRPLSRARAVPDRRRLADPPRHLRRPPRGGGDHQQPVEQKTVPDALPACRQIETIELSANEDSFKPGDKHAARLALGLPADKPIVLCAAVNFEEPRKGSAYFEGDCRGPCRTRSCSPPSATTRRKSPGWIGLGYHLKAHKLGQVYQAADIFLSTATEEAFGQTVMEAQALRAAVVAIQGRRVEAIVRNEITVQAGPPTAARPRPSGRDPGHAHRQALHEGGPAVGAGVRPGPLLHVVAGSSAGIFSLAGHVLAGTGNPRRPSRAIL